MHHNKLKVGVIGAGISGLTIAKLLSPDFDVEVLEEKNLPGGIARTKDIDGISYHLTGGHCFNSKYPEVLDFVFKNILAKEDWNIIERKSTIQLDGYEVSYPIEFAVKEIENFDFSAAEKIANDFHSLNPSSTSINMQDWFESHFGKTLTEIYFKPYNEKIWRQNLKDVTADWVIDKLPTPEKTQLLSSLEKKETDKMPHHFFYYPKSNNQNTLIDALAKDLNITYGYKSEHIGFITENKKWIVNSDKSFDVLVNTTPLDNFVKSIEDLPKELTDAVRKLTYNKLTTTLWETEPTNKTWTYIPSKQKIAHRYIHIGNFFRPAKNFTITEAIGEHTFNAIIESEKHNPFFIKPLAHHISDHAYVISDVNYKNIKNKLLSYLDEMNIYSLGRFAEWDYYNMDVCIKKSLDLNKLIRKDVF